MPPLLKWPCQDKSLKLIYHLHFCCIYSHKEESLSSTPQIASQARAAFEQTCALAIAQDLIEGQDDPAPDCAFIAEREGYGPQSFSPNGAGNLTPASFYVG